MTGVQTCALPIYNIFKMLLYWSIGGLLILIGLVVIYYFLSRANMVGILFGIIIIAFAVILIGYYTHKHDVELGPGYKSKPRRFRY